jgi:hypothetical protein
MVLGVTLRPSYFKTRTDVGALTRPELSVDKVIEMMVGWRLEDFYEQASPLSQREIFSCPEGWEKRESILPSDGER